MNIFSRKTKKKKIGLALGGGAALGLAHIGVLKYMEAINLKPSVITGTSIGSVIGGMYAGGIPINEIEKVALQFTNKAKVLSLLSFAFQKSGIISHANIGKFFRKYLGDKLIEDCEIPFVAVAVDLIHGNLVFIEKGNLVDAIQASISIPGVFNPFEANGTLLVDGGVKENLPLEPLQKFDSDLIIASDLIKTHNESTDSVFCSIDKNEKYIHKTNLNLFEKISDALKQKQLPKKNKEIPDMTTTGLQALRYIINENSRMKEQLYKPDIVINIKLDEFKIWEFWRAKELIEMGYQTTKKMLTDEKIERLS